MEHYLPYLAFLACPISMGAMMFFMMRGDKQQGRAAEQDPELEKLKREVEALRQSQAQDRNEEYASKAS